MAADKPTKISRMGDSHVPEDPWNDARTVHLPFGTGIMELVGLSSPTNTMFGRIVLPLLDDNSNGRQDAPSYYFIQQVVEWMLDKVKQQQNHQVDEKAVQLSANELLQLGAVWKLTTTTIGSGSSGTGKMKRTRQYLTNSNDILQLTSESLRVHFRPSRFSAAYRVDWTFPPSASAVPTLPTKPRAILHYDPDLGFAIIHKSSGLPSHATVDNGVENVLYQLEQQMMVGAGSDKAKHRRPSLPQRLDIETGGLLLVATSPEFSSYMGRLLQQKTLQAISYGDDGGSISKGDLRQKRETIHKQYRCLVKVTSLQQREDLLQQTVLEQSQGIVHHYVDPTSMAPKTFQLDPKEGWLKCVLRILHVGPLLKYEEEESSSVEGMKDDASSRHLKRKTEHIVMEIEVELLTGRTHQIRGQLAAMQLPVVGDPLYGQPGETITWDARRNRGADASKGNRRTGRLALQCCVLHFPKPKWGVNEKNRSILMQDNKAECTFRLDKPWWSDRLVNATSDKE